jgi:hypothetical protein
LPNLNVALVPHQRARPSDRGEIVCRLEHYRGPFNAAGLILEMHAIGGHSASGMNACNFFAGVDHLPYSFGNGYALPAEGPGIALRDFRDGSHGFDS